MLSAGGDAMGVMLAPALPFPHMEGRLNSVYHASLSIARRWDKGGCPTSCYNGAYRAYGCTGQGVAVGYGVCVGYNVGLLTGTGVCVGLHVGIRAGV